MELKFLGIIIIPNIKRRRELGLGFYQDTSKGTISLPSQKLRISFLKKEHFPVYGKFKCFFLLMKSERSLYEYFEASTFPYEI